MAHGPWLPLPYKATSTRILPSNSTLPKQPSVPALEDKKYLRHLLAVETPRGNSVTLTRMKNIFATMGICALSELFKACCSALQRSVQLKGLLGFQKVGEAPQVLHEHHVTHLWAHKPVCQTHISKLSLCILIEHLSVPVCENCPTTSSKRRGAHVHVAPMKTHRQEQ